MQIALFVVMPLVIRENLKKVKFLAFFNLFFVMIFWEEGKLLIFGID